MLTRLDRRRKGSNISGESGRCVNTIPILAKAPEQEAAMVAHYSTTARTKQSDNVTFYLLTLVIAIGAGVSVLALVLPWLNALSRLVQP